MHHGAHRITLRHSAIEWTPWGCVTRFPDGTEVGAHPHDMPHYHVIAHRCGYGDNRLAYCREHEFAHLFLCEALFDAPSPVLWALAHGGDLGKAAAEEEMAAQAFQRWLRAAERPIVGGVDWDDLKAVALHYLHIGS